MDSSKLPYTAISPDIDEYAYDNLPINKRVLSVAHDKCIAIQQKHPDSIIIAADTLTQTSDGGVIESKKSQLQAADLLGQEIHIYTGMYIAGPAEYTNELVTKTKICYAKTSKANLRRLLNNDERFLRSGALGIYFDAPGFGLIDYIEGSFSGALGLDLSFVYHCLGEIMSPEDTSQ